MVSLSFRANSQHMERTTSPDFSKVLMPSFSKITPTLQAFNIRTAFKQSTVFLANRETYLTIMMSMPPCLQAVSILLNSF